MCGAINWAIVKYKEIARRQKRKLVIIVVSDESGDDGKDVEEMYDPSVDLTLDEIAKLSGQFGAAHIIVEGHTDSSMKGQVPASLVKELSLNRANSIKQGLLQKYKELDPNRFAVEGMGWERPADANDPDNHFKNRRVEIKVYSAEQQ